MSTTVTYDVIGMTCDHCARAVTAEVGALDGVREVNVDLATGRVRVSAEHTLSTEDVRQSIEEAGYTLA